jgi:hypothetical protein
MGELEAQIASLMRQDVELLLRIPKKSHFETNREEHNTHTDGRDCHKNKFEEEDH